LAAKLQKITKNQPFLIIGCMFVKILGEFFKAKIRKEKIKDLSFLVKLYKTRMENEYDAKHFYTDIYFYADKN
jgi:hypothetical protein